MWWVSGGRLSWEYRKWRENRPQVINKRTIFFNILDVSFQQ